MGVVYLAVLVLANAIPALCAGSGVDNYEREMQRRWRARLVELDELQNKTRISLSGASLTDLGRIGFIFEEAGGVSRRPPHEFDRNCVFAAVDGQDDHELEESLPSMVNYLKLSTAARAMAISARYRQPLIGARKGMEMIERMERSVADFRKFQSERVRSGLIPAARVLTKTNLGELGRRSTYRELWRAYRDGERDYTFQNDLAGIVVFFGSLGLLSWAALFHLRRLAARHRFLRLLGQE